MTSAVKAFFASAVIPLLLLLPQPGAADPQPGDIFKEFFGKRFSLYVRANVIDSVEISIPVTDLEHAIGAELAVIESHAHIGTSDRSFRVNNGGKQELFKPDAPGSGYCYHYQHYGRMATTFPVQDLKEGENRIRFFKDRQICHNFNWSGWGASGGFVIRVYYNRQKEHPTGNITSPKKGSAIGDQLLVRAKVKSGNSSVTSVEFFARYYGYSYDGSGIFDNWHYFATTEKKWQGHIGTVTSMPYQCTWDLRWIPDQTSPMQIAAKLTDANGVCYITPAVEHITLKRKNRSVKMYLSSDLPEKFQSRLSARHTCTIDLPEQQSRIDSVRLASIIWQGHLEGKYKSLIGLNSVDLMVIENLEDKVDRSVYFPSLLPISPDLLRPGSNEFYVFSDTHGHMSEVYWPGPAILISFRP